jgi:hypothetical protein
MNADEQRMVLAHWMPANLVHFQDGVPLLHIWGDHFVEFKPDTDLNHIYEVEKQLNDAQRYESALKLLEMYNSKLKWFLRGWLQNIPKAIYEANASQRCEVVCRTLWPEKWNK